MLKSRVNVARARVRASRGVPRDVMHTLSRQQRFNLDNQVLKATPRGGPACCTSRDVGCCVM